MIRKINRFGEVTYNKNEALLQMPFARLDTEDVETLEENYRQKIKDMDYTSSFVYANHMGEIRDRLQMSYDLGSCVDFHHIHKIKLDDMLPFLYSMVDIARENVYVLWERNNVVIDLQEKKVKALIFEFEGFKIYKKDDGLDGLKELILLALTKNQTILGKPKRADYIEQTAKVFQFSEDVLSSKSIDEVENVIISYQREMEYEQLKIENEKAEKLERSKFNKIKERFKKKRKETNVSELIKDNLNKSNKSHASNSGKSTSLMEKITSPVGMVSIIGVIGALLLFFTFTDMDSQASSKEEKVTDELKLNKEILSAYRLYITNEGKDKEKAYDKLDSIGYKSLPKKDQETLINWYLEQEQYTKAIKESEESVYSIGDKIIGDYKDDLEEAVVKLEQIESSFTDNKVLKFDIASLKNKHQEVIENSDLDYYNERRAIETVKAFVLTNQTKELKELIETYKKDEESYDALTTHSDNYLDLYTDKREKAEESKALSEQIEELEEKKGKEKKKKKKKKIDKEIKSLQKELESTNEAIKKIDGNIADVD